MKRTLLIASTIALTALTAASQSFTVYNKNGKSKGFNNEDVERIEFSTSNLPEEPAPAVINFREKMTAIAPVDGTIDLTANPQGLGVFNISMQGIYMVNTETPKNIVLGSLAGDVFSCKADDPGMILNRDVLGGTTSFTYRFNVDGFTTPGYYYLLIPEGTYVDTNNNPLSASVHVYHIEVPAPAQTFTSTPAGGTVESISEISLKFDSYPFVDMAHAAHATITKSGSSQIVKDVVPTVGEDGTISLTVDPAITEAGTYNVNISGGTFALRCEEGGKAYTSEEVNIVYEIAGATQQAPKVGDFYYSDGTWNTYLVDKADAQPIGVIFYLGAATQYDDNAGSYYVKDGSEKMSEFHGYVVALRDATYADGDNEGVTWSFWNGNDPGCKCSSDITDFKGYSNTASIIQRANDEKGGLSDASNNFPATYYATTLFEQEFPAPAQSSGWFLPSAGQLQYIYDKVYFDPNNGDPNAACVEKSLNKLSEKGGMPMYTRNSEYWTSTEYYDNYGMSYKAYYSCYDSSMFDPGFISDYNKNAQFRVRAILAF